MSDKTAALVKRLRAERGLTQPRLGIAAGLDTKTIQRVEGGKEPSRETAQKLAAFFGVPLDQLLDQPAPEIVESRVVRDADEGHPLVEELIEEHPELDAEVIARLRKTYHRGADDDFVRKTLASALIAAQRPPKVEDRGQVADTKVREGARRIGSPKI